MNSRVRLRDSHDRSCRLRCRGATGISQIKAESAVYPDTIKHTRHVYTNTWCHTSPLLHYLTYNTKHLATKFIACSNRPAKALSENLQLASLLFRLQCVQLDLSASPSGTRRRRETLAIQTGWPVQGSAQIMMLSVTWAEDTYKSSKVRVSD